MKLTDITARLKASAPSLRTVELLQTITQIEEPDAHLPAAFVARGAVDVTENTGSGSLVSQRHRRRIDVVILADPPDEFGNEQLETVRDEVLTALTGFVVGDVQLLADGGEPGGMAGSSMRWREGFRYDEYVRVTT